MTTGGPGGIFERPGRGPKPGLRPDTLEDVWVVHFEMNPMSRTSRLGF